MSDGSAAVVGYASASGDGGGDTSGCTDAVLDDFNRTVSTGLGTATSGDVWVNTYGYTERAEVDGSHAILRTSGFETATYSVSNASGPWAGSFEVVTRFTWQASTGKLMFDVTDNAAGPELRYVRWSVEWNGSLVRAQLWDDPTFVDDTASVVITAGATAYLKASYDASSGLLQSKYWEEGDTEPDWQASVTLVLSNMPDLRMQFAAVGSYELLVDSITFSAADCCVGDSFSRTVADGWGLSDMGLPWLNYTGSYNSDAWASVNGSYGTYGAPVAAPNSWVFTWVEMPIDFIDPNFTATFRWRFAQDTSDVTVPVLFEIDGQWGTGLPGGTRKWRVSFWKDPTFQELGLFVSAGLFSDAAYTPGIGGGPGWVGGYPFVPDPTKWYRFRVTNIYGSQTKMRIWEDGQPEPETWALTLDTSGLENPELVPVYDDTRFPAILYFQNYSGDVGPAEYYLDDLYISFLGCCSIVDGFGRTDPSGWGDPWIVDPEAGVTYSVASGLGSITTDGSVGGIYLPLVDASWSMAVVIRFKHTGGSSFNFQVGVSAGVGVFGNQSGVQLSTIDAGANFIVYAAPPPRPPGGQYDYGDSVYHGRLARATGEWYQLRIGFTDISITGTLVRESTVHTFGDGDYGDFVYQSWSRSLDGPPSWLPNYLWLQLGYGAATIDIDWIKICGAAAEATVVAVPDIGVVSGSGP